MPDPGLLVVRPVLSWSLAEWQTMTEPLPLRNDPLAIAALVTGLLAYPCCCICALNIPMALLAAGLGFVALQRIKSHPDQWAGRGMALGGMAAGLTNLSLYVLVVALWLALGGFGALSGLQMTETFAEAERQVSAMEETFQETERQLAQAMEGGASKSPAAAADPALVALSTSKLPASLQAKIQQLQSDVLPYPDRASDISGMLDYIANGEFDMAEYKADAILEAQANLRAAAAGLPTGLKAKLQQVESQRIEYPDRSRDVASMQDYIAEGDFDMAEYKADAILEAQANLKRAAKGLPAGLQAKLNQVESERMDYPDRSRDVASMQDYIAQGDFDMAVYKADAILEAQGNLKRGIPTALKARMAEVESKRVDYPDRSRDIASMQDYLANGDFDMARYKADNIIEAQNNLR